MKTETIKVLNNLYDKKGYLDDDIVDETIIDELAEECQKGWESCINENIYNDEISGVISFTDDDDFEYYDGLDFKEEVLSNIISEECNFSVNDFGDDLIEKIAERSIEIYKNNVLNSLNLPKFFVLNEYGDTLGNSLYIAEFEMPDDDEVTYVAKWDNRNSYILDENDFDYVEKILFYDDKEDNFYLAERSYAPHPTMGCNCLKWSLDNLENAKGVEWDEVYNEELLDKFNNQY